jgi:hypothetical protein
VASSLVYGRLGAPSKVGSSRGVAKRDWKSPLVLVVASVGVGTRRRWGSSSVLTMGKSAVRDAEVAYL